MSKAIARTISEAQLQASVIDLAHTLGFLVFHARAARTKDGWRTPVAGDGVGFPDLLLVRGAAPERGWTPRIVFVELKSAGGQLSDQQVRWLATLGDAGAEHYVWRPTHWLSGEIEAILRGEVWRS